MRRALRAMVRNERGQVLPAVFVLLVLGALLIIPALQYGSTSLKGNQVTEKKEMELYAADSGVTDAVFWLQGDGDTGGRWNWDDVDLVWRRDSYGLNERTVDVEIEELGGNTYKVTSEAESAEGGSTTIESVVVLAYSDFGFMLDNAITSDDVVDIQPGTSVSGNISLPEDGSMEPPDFEPEPPYEVKQESLNWPSAEEFIEWFWNRLWEEGGVVHYEESTYDIPGNPTEGNPHQMGPMYTDGSLTVKGKGYVQLDGMLYIKGDLDFTATPSITLDLNGQTIFAEGDITMGSKITLTGDGCIVAIGDLDLQPQLASNEGDFVLLMSVTGTTWLKPQTGSSDFYGSIVGNAEVQLQPNCSINWVDPTGKDLVFPQGEGSAGDPGTTVTVATYNIS